MANGGRGGPGRQFVKQQSTYDPGAVKSRGTVTKTPKVDTSKTKSTDTKISPTKQTSTSTAGWTSKFQAQNQADAAARAAAQSSGNIVPTDKPDLTKLAGQKADPTGAGLIFGAGWESEAVGGLSGNLQTQLQALGDLEGGIRPGYDWTKDMMPMSVKEAASFLSGAANSEANDVLKISITPEMYQRAQDANYAGSADYEWARSFMDAYQADSTNMYVGPDGKILNPGGTQAEKDLVAGKRRIDSYRSISQGLIEDQRQQKQAMMQGAITHGYDIALTQAQGAQSAQAARIEMEGNQQIAAAQRALDERLAKAEIELTKSEGEADRTMRKDISAAEIAGRKDITRMQGEQSLAQIKAEGESQIQALREKIAGDKETQTRDIQARSQAQMRERDTAMLKIERESEAQRTLISLDSDLEMERESVKQQWQANESAKDRALQEDNLTEYRRAAMAQEQLSRDRMALEREGHSLQLLMSVSQNPALLYYMKQSGMLAGAGESILGENVENLIGDLSASIDPGNLPNIQTYNAMSELEQQITGTMAGATQGMSAEGMQDYVQGTSPFTRGRRSSIRIGSDRNPFEALG